MNVQSYTRRVASKLFRLLPENRFKNRLRAFLYNRRDHHFEVAYLPNTDLWTIRTGSNTFRFCSNPHSVLVTDLDYFRFMAPEPGDIVIDAGAFIGSFTVQAAKMVGHSGRVIALEPDLESSQVIKRNIDLNNLTNVTLYERGLWDNPGMMPFSHGNLLGSSIVMAEYDAPGAQIQVCTIDQLLADLATEHRLFIKMNIEGAEVAALRGAEVSLSRPHVALVVRTDHYVGGTLTTQSVEDFLKARDFTVQTITNSHSYGTPSITTYAAKGSFLGTLHSGLIGTGTNSPALL
jgi:FkbM family methyltransferase